MASLIIEVPDDLARSLEGIAAAQHTSVQQLAVERLRALVEVCPEQPLSGSAAAVLLAMREPPHLDASEVEEIDAAIAAGRMPVRVRDLFPE